jgi:hypothetical protein
MSYDHLTRPENHVDRRDRRRVLSRMAKEGPCTFCKHRVWAFIADRWVCERDAGRSFPLCTKDNRQPSFELDHETIKQGESTGER